MLSTVSLILFLSLIVNNLPSPTVSSASTLSLPSSTLTTVTTLIFLWSFSIVPIGSTIYPKIETFVGSSVGLPCNTSAPHDDVVQLILWFKNAHGTGSPFLKLDARPTSPNNLETGVLTIRPEYEDRIYFNVTSSPSILYINPVREDDGSIYSCRVDYKWSRTSISNINLFVIVRPLEVKIYPKKPLLAGQKAELTCESNGSRPPTKLTWLINEQELKDARSIVSADGMTTRSLVSFTPMPSLNGLSLICRAENPKIINSNISDNWFLQVYFVPKVALNLTGSDSDKDKNGKGLEGEGGGNGNGSSQVAVPFSSIQMKCDIRANPNVTEIRWLFNNEIMKSDASKGITIDGSILHLNISSKSQDGNYQCSAENSAGTGKSNIINLKVQAILDGPTCSESNSDVIYEVPIGETVNISCNIDPRVVNVTFYWKFISSHSIDDNNTITTTTTTTTTTTHHQPNSNKSKGVNNNMVNVKEFETSLTKKLSSTTKVITSNSSSSSSSSFLSPTTSTTSTTTTSPTSLKLSFPRDRIIRYQVNSSKDYGLLSCGLDSVTHVQPQNECQFRIKPFTALPYPPENCQLLRNSSDGSYLIKCSKSTKSTSPWKENYFLEVYDRNNLPLQSPPPSTASSSSSSSYLPIVMMNDDQPHFKISELPSNESTIFIIYSSNGAGKSSPVTLTLSSSSSAHNNLQSKPTNPDSTFISNEFIFILIGLLSITGLIGLTFYLCTLMIQSKRRKSIVPSDTQSITKASPNLSLKSHKISPKPSKIKTPDVIPLRINDSVNEVITLDEKWSKEEMMLDKNETILATPTQLDNYNQLYPDYSNNYNYNHHHQPNDNNIHVQLITTSSYLDNQSLDQDKMVNKSDDCLNDGQFIPVLIQFQDHHHQHILKNPTNPISLMDPRLPMTVGNGVGGGGGGAGDIQPFSMSTPV